MTSPPQDRAGRAHCENGELLPILAQKLENRGLDFKLLTYPNGMREDEHIEELVVTNPRARERGQFRIGDDGGITWEYFGRLDEAGITKILDDATNCLRATGVRSQPEPQS